MEKKKYKLSLFDQEFSFVSDDPEYIVNDIVAKIEKDVKDTYLKLNDSSSVGKIRILLLALVQSSLRTYSLEKEVENYKEKEKQLTSFLDENSALSDNNTQQL